MSPTPHTARIAGLLALATLAWGAAASLNAQEARRIGPGVYVWETSSAVADVAPKTTPAPETSTVQAQPQPQVQAEPQQQQPTARKPEPKTSGSAAAVSNMPTAAATQTTQQFPQPAQRGGPLFPATLAEEFPPPPALEEIEQPLATHAPTVKLPPPTDIRKPSQTRRPLFIRRNPSQYAAPGVSIYNRPHRESVAAQVRRLPSVPQAAPQLMSSGPKIASSAQVSPLPQSQVSGKPDSAAVDPRQQRAMAAVHQAADALIREGFSLGARGATYSSRQKFVRALERIAQALDADQQTNKQSQALVVGMRALEESESFIPRGAMLDGEIDVPSLVAGHHTPVLKGQTQGVSPLAALNRYYTFAQQQLADSVDGSPAASMALYGLGKLYWEISQEPAPRVLDPLAQAQVFHQAALLADGNNWKAANELSVLLARQGQYEQARDWLKHGLSLKQDPMLWNNLARVHYMLGEEQLAGMAQQRAVAAARQAGRSPTSLSHATPDVAWLPPDRFSEPPPQLPAVNAQKPKAEEDATQDAKAKDSGKRSWLPWK